MEAGRNLSGKPVSLNQKYDLRTPVPGLADASDRSVECVQISSGRPVTIHLLAGGHSAENEALLGEIEGLPPQYRVCFLEIGDHNGVPYVVTDGLAGNPPFRSWFASLKALLRTPEPAEPQDLRKARAWKIPALASSETRDESPGVPKPGHLAPEVVREEKVTAQTGSQPSPGEFTRLFQAAAPPAEAVSPSSGPVSPQVALLEAKVVFQQPVQPPAQPSVSASPGAALVDAPVSASKPASEPGEFTRMFAAPSPPPGSPPPRSEPLPPTAQGKMSEPAKPGEFTQMFSSNAAGAGNSFPRDPELPAKASQEGEFTRMMASPLARAGLRPEPFSPAEQPPGKPRDAGAFTRMMESPRALEAEVPPAPTPPRSTHTGAEAAHAVPYAESGQPAASASPPGPSEFTRMFKAPAKESAPAKKPAQAKAPRVVPRKKKNKAFLMWMLVGGVVVLIIALIVFFSLRN
jgi:hypothetical protein